MRLHTLLIIGLLSSLAPQAAFAKLTSLNFNALINNGTLSVGTIITDQYANRGVTFSLADTSHQPGPIADGFGNKKTRGLYNTGNKGIPIIATFSIDVRQVVFGGIFDTPITVTTFDASGQQITSATSQGKAPIAIETQTSIRKLAFLNDSGSGYLGRYDITALSLLRFGNENPITPVPLPPALLMFLSGFLVFLIPIIRSVSFR